MAAAYHLTTPFYYLVPTAPPWWASRHRGEMDGTVDHVLKEVIDDLRGRPDGEEEGDDPSGNPWASMPSDHIASAAITAMALSEVGPPYAALGWAYVLLAAFSVVYLGEHYAVDVLAGLLVAGGHPPRRAARGAGDPAHRSGSRAAEPQSPVTRE